MKNSNVYIFISVYPILAGLCIRAKIGNNISNFKIDTKCIFIYFFEMHATIIQTLDTNNMAYDSVAVLYDILAVIFLY